MPVNTTTGPVKVGDRAPDFTLPSQTGEQVSLHNLLGERALVLYFYPADDTSGCTAEACAFRDSYEVFKDTGADVVGVSPDSVASHQKFALKHRLPFMLLADEGQKVSTLYGVPSLLGIIRGRTTYVIDKEGVVQHVFNSLLQFKKHSKEALRILQELNQPKV